MPCLLCGSSGTDRDLELFVWGLCFGSGSLVVGLGFLPVRWAVSVVWCLFWYGLFPFAVVVRFSIMCCTSPSRVRFSDVWLEFARLAVSVSKHVKSTSTNNLDNVTINAKCDPTNLHKNDGTKQKKLSFFLSCFTVLSGTVGQAYT